MPVATPIEVTDGNFAIEVQQRSKELPVVVDFWAPWCGPCRVLGPVIEKVAGEYAGKVVLAKLNTDENPKISALFRIQGIPAVKAFKDGKVIAEFTGAYPEPQVRAFFDKIAPGPATRVTDDADALLRAGNVAAAEAAYRGILAKSPNQPDALVGLATVLLSRGDSDAASELLDRAPADRRAKVMKHRIFLDGFARKHAGEDLEAAVVAAPRDARARYRWGVMLAAREQYPAALDELLESIRNDKTFADGAARKAVLAVFDILGLDSDLTREYQRRLSNVLF
ncbi:MAG TPA: thioredoxin [Tepidiformaceae bacterium]|nr:thioredoxin [Tepidiformaceae bacterium]HNO65250.1 thioredoxin [Tepidiformaceae bacterium]